MSANSLAQFWSLLWEEKRINQEFSQVLEMIQALYPQTWKNFLESKAAMLEKYFASYALTTAPSCQQILPGYRLKVRFLNGKLFFTWCKCPHFAKLFSNLDQFYHYSDFAIDLKTKSFRDFAQWGQKMSVSLLWAEFDNILTQKSRPRLMFVHGNPGTGKTLFCALFCNGFIKHNQKTVAFINARRIILTIKDLWAQKKALQPFLQELISVDCLVIDDLGTENTSAYIRDEFVFPLLERRILQHKLTLLISQFPLEKLLKNYLYSNTNLEIWRHERFSTLLVNHATIYKLN